MADRQPKAQEERSAAHALHRLRREAERVRPPTATFGSRPKVLRLLHDKEGRTAAEGVEDGSGTWWQWFRGFLRDFQQRQNAGEQRLLEPKDS